MTIDRETKSNAVSVKESFEEAVRHHQAGRVIEAEHLYRRVLEIDPRHADAIHLIGVIARQAGRHDVAADMIRAAIAIDGSAAHYYYNLANALKDLGRLDDAIAAYNSAIQLNPSSGEAYSNLGNALKDQGRLDEAIVAYTTAIRIKPHAAEVHSNLGNALKAQGRLDDAIAAYTAAIRLKPDFAEAYSNLGVSLKDSGRLDEAVAAYETAIRLNPRVAGIHANLGNALKDVGRLDEAITACNTAIRLKPDYAEAYVNLGNALTLLCQFDQAITSHRLALSLDPDPKGGESGLLYTLSYHPTMPAGEIAQAFREWGNNVLRHIPRLPLSLRDPRGRRKLRIGYVSPDMREHTTRFYLLPLLEHHDRSEFELYAYSNVLRPDLHTERFRQLFDCWTDIRRLDDDAAAALIRSHDVDVLVDVTNHMADHRLGIFARKPVPVQATWLGTCWTTGLPTVDYAILDPFMAPEGSDELFVERVIRLPQTLFCYRPDDADLPLTRLPAERNGFVTFGYTGRSERLNHLVFAAWAAILAEVPTGRLVLDHSYFSDPLTIPHFREQMRNAGLDPVRVTFRRSSSAWQALADIDILLDSFPHSGGTMLFDAVWAGVPCVTLAARPPVGRVGTCIMSNLGLSDWISPAIEGYIATAVTKAARTDELADLRSRLRAMAAVSPLSDGKQFARAMEEAYRRMISAAGESPAR